MSSIYFIKSPICTYEIDLSTVRGLYLDENNFVTVTSSNGPKRKFPLGENPTSELNRLTAALESFRISKVASQPIVETTNKPTSRFILIPPNPNTVTILNLDNVVSILSRVSGEGLEFRIRSIGIPDPISFHLKGEAAIEFCNQIKSCTGLDILPSNTRLW